VLASDDAFSVHPASTAWTSEGSGAPYLEQPDRVLATVAGEVAIVPVDHREAGSHVAGEVEGGDAGTERKVAKVCRRS